MAQMIWCAGTCHLIVTLLQRFPSRLHSNERSGAIAAEDRRNRENVRAGRSRTPSGPIRRALQEVFVELAFNGLASMYPVSDWSLFAPDHHGYQRACDLINGQASTGHSDHQCSHAPGRPYSSRRPRRVRVCGYIIACPCNVLGNSAPNERPCARTLQAMRASLFASAIADTLRCSRFHASIQGLSPWRIAAFREHVSSADRGHHCGRDDRPMPGTVISRSLALS